MDVWIASSDYNLPSETTGTATNGHHLSFKNGSSLIVRDKNEQDHPGLWVGMDENGREGLFPYSLGSIKFDNA